MIKRRKARYYQREVDRLTTTGAHTLPYKVLKNIAEKEKTPTWMAHSIKPYMSPEAQEEELADFFTEISSQFPPLKMDAIPRVDLDRPVVDTTTTEVASRLIHMRKPKSAVSIDPPSRFINCVADILEIPLT